MADEYQVRYVRLRDGCLIAVHDFGGTGRPLIFLHANGFHAWSYWPMVVFLRDSFRCLGVDLRAHGDSQRGTLPLSPETFRTDLAEVLDALALRGCYAFGHSLGGGAMLLEAEQNGYFGGLYTFEAVLRSSTITLKDFYKDLGTDMGNAPGLALAKMAMQRKNSFESVDEAYGRLSKRPPFSDFHPSALQQHLKHGLHKTEGSSLFSWKCDPRDEASIFESNVVPPAVDCKKVNCPVLVAAGVQLQSLHAHLQRAAQILAKHLKNSEFHGFEGLGHLGPLEDPQRIALDVKAFFTGLEQGGVQLGTISKL